MSLKWSRLQGHPVAHTVVGACLRAPKEPLRTDAPHTWERRAPEPRLSLCVVNPRMGGDHRHAMRPCQFRRGPIPHAR